MSLRLRSEKDYRQTLTLNSRAWQSVLDLAGEHGWQPMGTVRPEPPAWPGTTRRDEKTDEHSRLAYGLALSGYAAQADRMVLAEDALNLADALERAFVHRERANRRADGGAVFSSGVTRVEDLSPGVGVIRAVVDLCRTGAFWIEQT